jgi:hypothetical protein
LRAGDKQLERRRGLDILDADGEDRFVLADRPLNFAGDESRLVARGGEDQDKAARFLNASDDLVAVGATGGYATRRNPRLSP